MKSATCYLRDVTLHFARFSTPNIYYKLQPTPCRVPNREVLFGSCPCRSDSNKKKKKKQREILPESIGQLNRFCAGGGGGPDRPKSARWLGSMSLGTRHIFQPQAFPVLVARCLGGGPGFRVFTTYPVKVVQGNYVVLACVIQGNYTTERR